MGMFYKTGFDFNYKDPYDFSGCLELPLQTSLSAGQSVETSARFSHDYTKTSQSITRCKRLMARTFSAQFRMTRQEYADLFERLAAFEDSVGKTGQFYQSDALIGLVIISSVSLSLETGSDGLHALSVGFELTEAQEPGKPSKRINPQTIRRLEQ